MFEDRTPEALKAEALARIHPATGLSALEGGFADSVIGPAAERVSEFYQALPAVVSMLFVDEGSGGYIDLVAKTYFNLSRKPGTKARCTVTLSGDAGAVLPAGTAFLTAEGLVFYLLSAVTLGAGGEAQGALEAADIGAEYNLEAGALTRMYVNPVGLAAFSSGAATGGTDRESDAALLGRMDERRKRPATSGNGYQYRQWAMEVAGVGEAKVVELAAGPGTLALTLTDAALAPASPEIVAAADAAIATKRPIGATPTVRSAEALTLTVAATVVLAASTTADAVRAVFVSKLDTYCRELVGEKFRRVYYSPEEDLPYTLIYNRVAALLLTIEGVVNYTALTVNDAAADIAIPADSVPVVGEVTVVWAI